MIAMDYPLLLLLMVIVAVLFILMRFLIRCLQSSRTPRGRVERESRKSCVDIPPHIYRRPDPMIYSQDYLMEQGLAITWDNPDIQLFDQGVPVSSHELKPDRMYEVVARIWNGSTDAPAVNLPVRFSYLNFGIGQTGIPIGQTFVDLPAKGAVGHPVYARQTWSTPATPGHYCLKVELVWGDDANPFNNLGQENVDVKPLNSPNADFSIRVQNNGDRRKRFNMEIDTYQIGEQPICEHPTLAETNRLTKIEMAERRQNVISRHGKELFQIPSGWSVSVEPREILLSPGEEQDIQVSITAPDGFSGRQNFNLNAFSEDRLLGGVTLKVDG